MALEHWMKNLPDDIRKRPLSEVAIPGSHDSDCGEMTVNSGPGPDLDPNLRRILRLGCLTRRIVFNWSHTQGAGLTEQLHAGIRYLDLRLCFVVKSKSFWLTHGLLASTFQHALEEIKSFVSTHDGEVVLLDFNHFYAMQEAQHKAAAEMICSALKSWLCQPAKEDAMLPSLKDCQERGHRVIVFYHAPDYLNHEAFWKGSAIPSPWPNVISKNKLFAFLEKKYKAGRDNKKFYVTQGVLTPTATYIVLHLFKNLRKLAKEVHPAFIRWLHDKKAGPEGINICIVDFALQSSYIEDVIALNR